MNESKNYRALTVFEAVGRISDNYVAAAETALYEAEAGICRPAKRRGPLRRFLSGGLGAAVISGIVALTVLFLIIRAGQQAPVHGYPPVVSSIPQSKEQADFSITVEKSYYLAGDDSITVIVTHRTPGESLNVYNAWYLERITDDGVPFKDGPRAVDIFYTEEAIEARAPGADEHATISKKIQIPDGLKGGEYRLHATRHNGTEYESVAYCQFEVRTPEAGKIISDPSFRYKPSATEVAFTFQANDLTPDVRNENLILSLSYFAKEPAISLVGQPRYLYIQPEAGLYDSTDDLLWEAVYATAESFIGYADAEEGGYAFFTDRITLFDSGKWKPGAYRVYVLSEPFSETNTYTASCTFVIPKPGEPFEVENMGTPLDKNYSFTRRPSAVEVPFTISVEDIDCGTNQLTVTVTATEPGVPLINPPRYWLIESRSGDNVSVFDPEINWEISPEEITAVYPAGEDEYAQFTDTITLHNPDKWQPGAYIIFALTKPLQEENLFVDSCTFTIRE